MTSSTVESLVGAEARGQTATSCATGLSRLPLLFSATLLSVLLVASILAVDYLPTSDGPERIFSGYVQNHLHDSARGYDRYLRVVPTLTDCGFETVFAQLEPHLGWRLAYQGTLCLIALLWAWGLLALAITLGDSQAWLGLLGFGTALQWSFYMGQFSFQMGAGLGFLVLAWAFRQREHGGLDRILLAALLLTQVIVHAFTAVLTGGVLMLHTLMACAPKRRRRAVSTLIAVGLPAAAIAAWTLAHHLGNASAGQYNYPATPLGQRLALLGRGFVSGPWWRAWAPTLLAVCPLVRLRWRERDARARALAIVGIALAGCAILLPLHTRSWEFFSVRFTPYAVVFLLLLLPLPAHRTWRAVLVGALMAYSVGAIAWSWHHHLRLHRASADILAGLDAPVKRTGLRLPLPLDPPPGEDRDEWLREIPFSTNNGHLGALYAVEQGGVPAVLFAGLTAQGLAWLKPLTSWMPPLPVRGFEWQLWEPGVEQDPHQRRAGLVYYLSYARPFEDVILHARPTDAALLGELGFVIDFQQGGLFVTRFQGCALSLNVVAPEEGPVPLLVTAGWLPNARPVYSTAIAVADTAGPHQLARTPCGQAWFRGIFDMDGNGVPSAGDRACATANERGFLAYQGRSGSSDHLVCSPGAVLAEP